MPMRLDGLHHITMITGDAQRNVDFYAGVLGLRLVKKTVNFDAPEAYHLYFGDERGTPGSILTWFEFAGAAGGRAGAGMIHTLELGVASEHSLQFWSERLRAHGYATESSQGSLRFVDDDGLRLALVSSAADNAPLRAEHPEIPAEHAICGVEGARAYGVFARVKETFLTDPLGFRDDGDGAYVIAGVRRSFRWAYDRPPEAAGRQGAGTVHHIAWACQDEDQVAWQTLVSELGGYVTDVRDRDYFRSIYFREPRGILFEIATLSPGFAVDEDPAHLGEQLRLPKMHEHLRSGLERTLTPVVNPRSGGTQAIA
jgi:glyoxalase family protein